MCLVCKEEFYMADLGLSNNIEVGADSYLTHTAKFCTYCGAVFVDNGELGIDREDKE